MKPAKLSSYSVFNRPTNPGRWPASSKMAAIRFVVVVFPLVPVTRLYLNVD